MERFQVGDVAMVRPGCWERFSDRLGRMTSTERNYFVATYVLLIVVAAFVLSFTVAYILSPGYCSSKECIRTAAQILGNINSSADPCTDFYEYACGGWKGIGGDEEDNWSLRMLRDTTRQAAELLSQSSVKTDFEAVKKAREIFRSCMATDDLDELGLEPLLELLERAGLPRGIPNKDTAVDFDLSRTIARIHRTLGKPVLIDVLRESNETFTVWMPPLDLGDTPNIAVLEAIDAWVNRDSINYTTVENNSTLKAEWQGFFNSISTFVEDMEVLRTRRFGGVFEFDSTSGFLPPKMKRLRLPASRITTILYNGTVPKNASNTLYYEVYMESLLEGRANVNWTLNQGTLRLADPEYHSFLVSALRDFSPVHIQMLVWMEVIKHFGVHTTTSLRQRMKNRLAAMKSQSPRSESCGELVIDLMPVVVDHLMSQVDPIIEVTREIKAMTKEIQISQKELVQQSAEWLGEMGLRNIHGHLDDVKVARVGYVDWVRDGKGMDEFFKEVVIQDGQLLRTMAAIQIWQAETNLLVSPVIGRLRTDHVMASAYYYRSMNTITVRPMIMRFPFYPLGLHSLNYGAMGLVLGHEFGHALDAEAFLANDYFFLENPAIARVNKFINCTKKRILKFASKLETIASPDQSINEDVSDISALRSALYTYHKTRPVREARLPGLEQFTPTQLFFLAFANVWCTNGKPPGPDAEDGPHNANKLRILSAASNTPEFAETWGCLEEVPMNPRDKCTLW